MEDLRRGGECFRGSSERAEREPGHERREGVSHSTSARARMQLTRVQRLAVRATNARRGGSSQGVNTYHFLRSYAAYQTQTSLKRLQTRATLLAAGTRSPSTLPLPSLLTLHPPAALSPPPPPPPAALSPPHCRACSTSPCTPRAPSGGRAVWPPPLPPSCQISPLPISHYRSKFQSNLVWDSIKSISNFCFQF